MAYAAGPETERQEGAMKFRYLSILALLAACAPGPAHSQGGVLQSGAVTPGHATVWLSNGIIADGGAITGATMPGGSSGQVQYNNAGGFGGFTMGGDCTLSTGSGSITCLKTNGSPFGAAALLGVGAGLTTSGSSLTLATPSASVLGGVKSLTATSHLFLTSITTAGLPVAAQPAFGDLTGAATLAQLPSIAGSTVLGNVTGGTTTPTALSQTQLTALINPFTSSLPGTAPASGGGAVNYLRADGTWHNPLSGTILVGDISASDSSLNINGLDGASAGYVAVTGGASSSAGQGGAALLTGGLNSGGGNGGDVLITGGAAFGSGNGGALTLASGRAISSGQAGVINISAGVSVASPGPDITITGGAGNGGTNAGGNINLVGGVPVSTGIPGEVQIAGDGNLAFATYYFTGTPAATNQVFFVATRPMRVRSISCIFSAAAGGVSTLTVTKDTSSNAPGAGTSLYQSGSCNLNSTINTPQVATVSSTVATTKLLTGDRLAVNFANTIQSSAGVVVTVGMQPD